jgi:hypothetical protein
VTYPLYYYAEFDPSFYFNSSFLAMDREKFSPIKYHKVIFGAGYKDEETKARTKLYEVVRFDVAEGWVSFHHSLHWLLAELFKSTHLLSEPRLKEEFGGTEFEEYRSLKDIVVRCAGSDKAVLAIIDYPLRGEMLTTDFGSNSKADTISTSSRHGSPDSSWPMGTQWLCHSWPTHALPRLHAQGAVL